MSQSRCKDSPKKEFGNRSGVCACVHTRMHTEFREREQHELHSDRGDLHVAEATCGKGRPRVEEARGELIGRALGVLLRGCSFGSKALKSLGRNLGRGWV